MLEAFARPVQEVALEYKPVADIVAVVLALIGAGIALATYRRSVRLKRAEWIDKLHEKFYESSNYKHIRQLLDYPHDPELEELRKGLAGENPDIELCESFVDYLNFFEYIASLWRLKQVSVKEVLMLFEYYLGLLNKHDFAKKFIRKYGFESLEMLLQQVQPPAGAKPHGRG
jgi:hypothetical protein